MKPDILASVNPFCLINIILAFLAIALYILGSYRLYKGESKFIMYFSLAIFIDVLTAVMASTKITPTTDIGNMVSVPWYSVLFNIHVLLSCIGIVGFVTLYIYLVTRRDRPCRSWIRKMQFKVLLPIWILGETIALVNAVAKVLFNVRIFDLIWLECEESFKKMKSVYC